MLYEYMDKNVIIAFEDQKVLMGRVVGYEPDFDTDSGEDEIDLFVQEVPDCYVVIKESEIKSIKEVA